MYNIISFWRDNNSSDKLNCFCSHANLNKDISDIVKKIKCSDSPKVQLHFIAKILDFFIQQNTNTNNNGRLLLLLEKSLDEQWQNYKWEEITLPYKNETLNKYVLVIRYADLTYYKANNFDNFKHFYNNQLPKDFPRENENFFSTNILSKVNFTDKFSKGQNSIENGELFIFAHGSQNGILDKKCQELDFFNTFPNVPKRIWLIACNEENINANNNESGVYKIAKKLISDKYCDTVITATTPLNAYCMSAMVQKWFNNNDNNIVDPAVFLSEIQNDNTNGGVFNLTIFGNIYIACDDVQAWNYSYWLKEHNIRATNQNFIVSKNTFDNADKCLNNNSLWKNTKNNYLLSELLFLAEEVDHSKIKKYQIEINKLLNSDNDYNYNSCNIYRSLSKSARREGKYNASVNYLVKAICLFDKYKHTCDFNLSNLYRELSNIFIDFNLPETAEHFLTLSANNNNEIDNKNECKNLDLKARIYIRKNCFNNAIQCFKEKDELRKTIDECKDSLRELSAIIYNISWHKNHYEILNNYIQEACKTLNNISENDITNENDDYIYLLRALSVFYWNYYDAANNINEVEKVILKWLAYCKNNLNKLDNGPIAYTLIFASLNAKNLLTSDEVDKILNNLQDDYYYLETAVFCLLLDRFEQAKKSLKNFQRMRGDISIDILKENENFCKLSDISYKEISEEIEDRKIKENEIFNTYNKNNGELIRQIIEYGILPL